MGNIVNICILVINIIVFICMIVSIVKLSGMNKALSKKLNSISAVCDSIYQQSNIKNEIPKLQEQLLAQVKSAVSSAVAEQMKYEIKEFQKEFQKETQKEVEESTIIMPKVKTEKAGSVLCRNCYKPYVVTERKCPYCNTKR